MGDDMEQPTKRLYVLLIRSRSVPSMLIRFFTKAKYTHSSLGFSEDCMQLYSFARKYESLPLPGCFTTEKIDRGFLGKDPETPCALFYFDVTTDVFESVNAEVNMMYEKQHQYKYNYLGLILCGLGIEKTRKNKYFCSEFVSHILKKTGALPIEKHPSVFRPVDFLKMDELKLIYEGNIGGLRDKILINV